MTTTKMLDAITLDAVKAKSISQHLRMGPSKSHFNPDVTKFQRLAELGGRIRTVFMEACIERPGGMDSYALQHELFELAATALIWAELLDKDISIRCPHGRAIGTPCSICGQE